MKRFIAITVLTAFVTGPMLGCARYQDYSRAVAESNETASTARVKIAKEVVGIIITKFDEAIQAESLKKAGEQAPMVTFEYTDYEGVTHSNTVYHPPPDPSTALIMKGLARAMVIRETVPLVEALIKDMTQKVQKPITVEDILYRIADEGALLVTMGAMYGVTKAAVKAVRSDINAYSSDGGQVSIDNGGPSDNAYTQDNSVKTEVVEPAVEEEE